jgi:hypothetical protein
MAIISASALTLFRSRNVLKGNWKFFAATLVVALASSVAGPSPAVAAASQRPADEVLHSDHIGGLTTQDGKRVFPNADIVVSKAESDFWLSPDGAVKAPKA